MPFIMEPGDRQPSKWEIRFAWAYVIVFGTFFIALALSPWVGP